MIKFFKKAEKYVSIFEQPSSDSEITIKKEHINTGETVTIGAESNCFAVKYSIDLAQIEHFSDGKTMLFVVDGATKAFCQQVAELTAGTAVTTLTLNGFKKHGSFKVSDSAFFMHMCAKFELYEVPSRAAKAFCKKAGIVCANNYPVCKFTDDEDGLRISFRYGADEVKIKRDQRADVCRHNVADFAQTEAFKANKKNPEYQVAFLADLINFRGHAEFIEKHFNIAGAQFAANYFQKTNIRVPYVSGMEAPQHRKGDVVALSQTKKRKVEEVKNELDFVFKGILKEGKGVHVIKAPVGIGKTEFYVNALKDNSYMVAVPTHALKDDVENRITENGMNVETTPLLPMLSEENQARLERLYASGMQRKAGMMVQALARGNGPDAEICKNYGIKNERAKRTPYPVITTHARGLSQEFNQNVLIIDEDPFQEMFQVKRVAINQLRQMLTMYVATTGKYKGPDWNEKANKAISALSGNKNWKPVENFLTIFDDEDLEMQSGDPTEIAGDVISVINSKFLVFCGEEVLYVKETPLPVDRYEMIVILSATASAEIYKHIAPDAKFYDLGEVEQKGKVIQITKKSFAKSSLNEKTKEEAERLINKYNPGSKIITYKDSDFFETDMHHGNTAGLNTLKGENVTVIGAFNLNPVAYQMLGLQIFTKYNDFLKCNDYIEGLEMEYVWTKSENYQFHYQTFSDSRMRALQFYLVESQLIQAAGRARTVWEDCTCLILSNFPIRMADIYAE